MTGETDKASSPMYDIDPLLNTFTILPIWSIIARLHSISIDRKVGIDF